MTRHSVVLLLGGNLGDREAILASARAEIEAGIGPVVRASREYASAPWGAFAEGDAQGMFLNQALLVETALGPEEVLDAVQRIERRLGRLEHDADFGADGRRLYRDRTIDIDILFYDVETIDNKRLTVPHPRLCERRFALEPAAEICPDFVHPALKISLKELFNSLLLGDSK